MCNSLSAFVTVFPVRGQVKKTPDTEKDDGSLCGTAEPLRRYKKVEKQVMLGLNDYKQDINNVVLPLCFVCLTLKVPNY